MRTVSRSSLLLAAAVAALALTGCPKGGLPGVPGGGNLPGRGGESGMVDPNTCGNYATTDAGRKLKNFLIATQKLQKVSEETVQVVRQSCIMIGNELGMTEADYKGETKDICAKVYGTIQENMKVAFKGQAALQVSYKPAVCRVDARAQAEAAAQCEGKASADIQATCSGTCRGTCEGTCAGKAGTGGSSGQCDGQCKGTCRGECEGHADVNASAQCKAHASVEASVDVQCTEPELDIQADAKLVLDKSKADMTIRALKAGLPKILSVKARLEPLKYAVEAWAFAAKDLKSSAGTLAASFKDQAMCISGQIAAAANLIGQIQVNVSVSVEVSASASGTIGG
jgi:modification target Cys-rich repeat protein